MKGLEASARDELLELKRRISRRYLGKHGVHGVGLRESQDAICLYVDDETQLDEPLRAALREMLGEHNLIVVSVERAALSN